MSSLNRTMVGLLLHFYICGPCRNRIKKRDEASVLNF